MKKTFIIFVLLLNVGCTSTSQLGSKAKVGELNVNMPVSRGQAVKMLALSRNSVDEINAMQRSIDFEDTEVDNWCDKYINAAVCGKIVSGTQENTFLCDENLTLEQADFIIKNLSGDKKLSLQYDTADRKKPIAYDVWLQAYDAIKGDAKEAEIVIFADSNTCSQLKSGYALSSEGLVNMEGVEMGEELLNCGIKAYMRDNAVLAFKEVTTLTPQIEAEVAKVDDRGAYLGINGAEIFFYNNTERELNVGDKIKATIDGNKIIALA